MHFFLRVAQRIPRGKGRDNPIGSRKLLGRNISTFCEAGRPLPSTPSPGMRARQGSRAHRRQLSAWAAWPGRRFATSPWLGCHHPHTVPPQYLSILEDSSPLATSLLLAAPGTLRQGEHQCLSHPRGFMQQLLRSTGPQRWEGWRRKGGRERGKVARRHLEQQRAS